MKYYKYHWSSLLYNVLQSPQDKLHRLQGPEQNENAGMFSKIIMDFQAVTSEHSTQHGRFQVQGLVCLHRSHSRCQLWLSLFSAFPNSGLGLCSSIFMLLLHIYVLTNIMECYFVYFKILHKWHNPVCVPRLLAYLTCCFCDLSVWICVDFIDFHYCLIFQCVISPQFIFPVPSIFFFYHN